MPSVCTWASCRSRGETGPDEPAGTAVVAATLAMCLHTLADAGVTATQLDGHDTDVYLAPVTRTLPPGHTDRLPGRAPADRMTNRHPDLPLRAR